MPRRFTIVVCAPVTVLAIGITVVARRSDRTTAARPIPSPLTTAVDQPPTPGSASDTVAAAASAAGAGRQPASGSDTAVAATTRSTAPAFVTVAPPAATPTTAAADPLASGPFATTLQPAESPAPDSVAAAVPGAVVAAGGVAGTGAGVAATHGAPNAECPDTEHGAIVDRAVRRGWRLRPGQLLTTSAAFTPGIRRA